MSSKGFQAGEQAEGPLLWVEAFRDSGGLSAAVSALKGRVWHIFSRNRRQESWVNKGHPALGDVPRAKLKETSHDSRCLEGPSPCHRGPAAQPPTGSPGHSSSPYFSSFWQLNTHLPLVRYYGLTGRISFLNQTARALETGTVSVGPSNPVAGSTGGLPQKTCQWFN